MIHVDYVPLPNINHLDYNLKWDGLIYHISLIQLNGSNDSATDASFENIQDF